jgi:hypothetical protein
MGAVASFERRAGEQYGNRLVHFLFYRNSNYRRDLHDNEIVDQSVGKSYSSPRRRQDMREGGCKMKTLTPMQTSLLMNFQLVLKRAEHCAMRINLGMYRGRIVHKGGLDGPLMTNTELLEDEMKTHQAHINLANELSDSFNSTLTEEDRRELRL